MLVWEEGGRHDDSDRVLVLSYVILGHDLALKGWLGLATCLGTRLVMIFFLRDPSSGEGKDADGSRDTSGTDGERNRK